MQYTQYYESPLGKILLSGTETHLTGLWFVGQKYYAATLPKEHCEKDLAIFDQTRKWLDIYFSGSKPDFTPPLSMETTPFRKTVWEILLTIPYGQTMTYGEISKKIAKQNGLASMSSQAVGGAVGHNAISLIIPCHRVVGANGNPTGYAGGIDKKIYLLELEKRSISVDTLGFGCILPSAGRIGDFHPLERVPTGRTKTIASILNGCYTDKN